MKTGIVGDFSVPNEEELELINAYTRRKFTAEEIYVFSVVLCDNEIDRDFERFTDEALGKMAELFIGKTGIFDHSHKTENQCARIFSCSFQYVEGQNNSLGKPYGRLFARAYMPKSERTKELILEIDAGIKKEVSVGLSMGKSVCSICGEMAGSCNHKKGKQYRISGKKQLCYYDLCEPYDAYEWSFVAVPAQQKAGVVKAFCEEPEIVIGNLTKSFQKGNVVLSADEAKSLAVAFETQKAEADKAAEFLKRKKLSVIKTFMPEASEETQKLMMAAIDRLEFSELYSLYCKAGLEKEPVVCELEVGVKQPVKTSNRNNNFVI